MAADFATDERDSIHIWVACPGCGYGGRIGLPLDFPTEVVVCPTCHEVVRVKPQDRVLWQPADAIEFLRQRFPSVDWDAVEPPPSDAFRQSGLSVDTNPKRQRGRVDENPSGEGRHSRGGSRSRGSRKAPRLRVGFVSRMLDDHFVQAALMLAGFVIPLAVTLLLAPRASRIEHSGEQLAEAVPRSAPNATAPGPKAAPAQQAPPAPNPPEPAAADSAAADSPAMDDAAPPDNAAVPEEAPRENPPPFGPDPPELFAPRPAAESDVQRFLALYDRAAQLADDGDQERARAMLIPLTAMHAPDAECLMCRAKAHAFLGHHVRGLNDATAAIQLAQRDARAWHTRAMILAEDGNAKAALDDMIVAVRLATRGRYELDYVNQVTEYAKSLAKRANKERNPHLASPGGRGNAGRLAAADSASGQSRSAALRHHQRGIEQFRQGTHGEAVVEFTEAIRLMPDSAASYHWRACSLIELRQFDAALPDMNRSLSLRGSYPVAFHARAVVLERLGRHREAYADMVEALRLSPDNPIYLNYLGRLRAQVDAREAKGVELPWKVAMKVPASSRWALRVPDLITVRNSEGP